MRGLLATSGWRALRPRPGRPWNRRAAGTDRRGRSRRDRCRPVRSRSPRRFPPDHRPSACAGPSMGSSGRPAAGTGSAVEVAAWAEDALIAVSADGPAPGPDLSIRLPPPWGPARGVGGADGAAVVELLLPGALRLRRPAEARLLLRTRARRGSRRPRAPLAGGHRRPVRKEHHAMRPPARRRPRPSPGGRTSHTPGTSRSRDRLGGDVRRGRRDQVHPHAVGPGRGQGSGSQPAGPPWPPPSIVGRPGLAVVEVEAHQRSAAAPQQRRSRRPAS